MATNSWIELIKKNVKLIKAEKKLKGTAIIKEAIKRSKAEVKSTKK